MSDIRHLLSLEDITPTELGDILTLAANVKSSPNEWRTALSGQTLAMIFQKRSTRTRVSFEVGMYQLGGSAIFLGASDIQIGRGETIADTARVLGRYCDLIMARVYAHSVLEEMAAHSPVPVINGLSDALHPCQVLADLQTMIEQFGDLRGRTLCYLGDGNNMAHSLLLGCTQVGMSVHIGTPPGYEPEPEYVRRAEAHAATHGGSILVTTDPMTAAEGVDVVYTDVWASMGQEDEHAKRLQEFSGFQVDDRIMSTAKPTAIFMHCLPAHRGEEVSASVADGPQSVIFDEAENRLHAQKALMLFLKNAG
jgi:ornithine carbamoyltransferase